MSEPIQVFDGDGVDPVPANVRQMRDFARRLVRAREIADEHDIKVEQEDYETWSPLANTENHDEILVHKIEEMFGGID